MPSAKSRRRQQSGAARNKPIRTKARTAVAQARTAIEAAAASDEAQAAVKAASSALDRAATKGVIHPNNAARRKSRLAKRLNKASAGA